MVFNLTVLASQSRENRISLNDYSGMGIDFCRSVAASLFGGDTKAVKYVGLESSSDGFASLVDEETDVMARVIWNLKNDVN